MKKLLVIITGVFINTAIVQTSLTSDSKRWLQIASGYFDNQDKTVIAPQFDDDIIWPRQTRAEIRTE